jgi:G3E family GTPase
MTTRLLLTGGFLGAGKTTLLLKAARYLTKQGYRVGVVTNDQAEDLVDTAMVRQYDIPVMEVAGGCFCCRFSDLLTSIERLQEIAHPDIILAEPVGSCTDLISTIFRPLRAYYSAQFQVAPLTVLVDPFRDPTSFPEEVGYIYEKQLTEANLIVISKKDLLDEKATQAHLQTLQQHFPTVQVLTLSAQTGEGLQEWLEICLQQSSDIEQVLEMNYETYAQGEAHLGWLNAKGLVSSPVPFSPSAWITSVFQMIERECQKRGAAVAHVKMHVVAKEQTLKASLTQLGSQISWDLGPTDEKTTQAHFILNARVGTTPETLEALVRLALSQVGEQMGTHLELTDLSCFSPLPPRPLYRLLSV